MDNILTVSNVKIFLNNNPLFKDLSERDKDIVLTQAWNNVFELINHSTVLNNDDYNPLYDESVRIYPQSSYSTEELRAILNKHVSLDSASFNVLIALVSQKIARKKTGYYFDTYREDKFLLTRTIGIFESEVEAEKKILWLKQRFLEVGLELNISNDELLMKKFVPNQPLVLEFEVVNISDSIRKLIPQSSLLLDIFLGEYHVIYDKTPNNSMELDYVIFDNTGQKETAPSNPVVVAFRHVDGYNVIKWGGDGTADWWRIEREVGGSGTWETIVVVGENETTYLDKDITEGNNYSYKVIGINSGGESSEVEAPIEKI